MLNKAISSGAILNPVVKILQDIDDITLQFTETELQINDIFKDIEISI